MMFQLQPGSAITSSMVNQRHAHPGSLKSLRLYLRVHIPRLDKLGSDGLYRHMTYVLRSNGISRLVFSINGKSISAVAISGSEPE